MESKHFPLRTETCLQLSLLVRIPRFHRDPPLHGFSRQQWSQLGAWGGKLTNTRARTRSGLRRPHWRLARSPAEPGADHPHCGPALSIRHTETFLIKGALPPVLGGLRFGRPQWDHTLPGYQAVVKAVDPAEVVLVRDEPSSGHSQPRTPKHVQGVCGPWALLGQPSQEVPARGTHPQPPPRTLLARGP